MNNTKSTCDHDNKRQHCRWALLGLSAIAVKFVKDLLLPRPENGQLTHSVVAVGTTGGEERARRWLAEQPSIADVKAVQVFTSYADLLQQGEFDVVYISTPLGLHFGNAGDALRAGRHVLLEKPAVVTAAQWAALGQLARTEGVVLMEAMWTRYQPAVEAFRGVVAPLLGPVRRIFADFSLPILPDPALASHSRFLDWRTGAGSLLDLGVYPLTWVDLALDGAPARVVHAHTITHDTPTGPIDDLTTVVLQRDQPPACTAIVTVSLSIPGSALPPHDARLVAPKNTPAVRIQGEWAEASVAFPPIRAGCIHVDHYGPSRVGELTEEDVHRPLHGWGLWYQADVIARAVLDRPLNLREKGRGLVIGEEGTARVFAWLDQARQLAGIRFPPELEAL